MKIFSSMFLLLALACTHPVQAATPVAYARITGDINFVKPGDSIVLTLYQYGGFEYNTLAASQSRYTAFLSGHTFTFTVPLKDHPCYMNLVFAGRNPHNIWTYIIAAGDNIHIRSKGAALEFTGQGKEVWNLQTRLLKIWQSNTQQSPPSLAGLTADCAAIDHAVHCGLLHLDSNKNQLRREVYEMLKGDIWGNGEILKYANVHYLYGLYKDSGSQILLSMAQYHHPVLTSRFLLHSPYIHYSNYLYEGLLDQYKLDSCLLTGRPYDFKKACNYFKQNEEGLLREEIITYVLFSERSGRLDVSSINKALGFIRHKEWRALLESLRSSRIKGAAAYNFSLPDSAGRKFTLADCKGKVVVLDFWFTGCGACRNLLPFLQTVEEKFSKEPVVFISICTDKNKKQWIQSVQEGKYTSPRTVNLYTEGFGHEHPLLHHYDINAYPTLLLIDQQGKLGDNPVDPRRDKGENLRSLIAGILNGK